MASKSAAEHAAVKDCESRGGSGCEPFLTYYNQCVAVANTLDGSRSASQNADEVSSAKKLALQRCEKENSVACEIVFTDCSKPIYHAN